ncbi:MAG: EamA family transporter [Clostridiales bacterium]|nr:EamA family transporter [Clostridiales bacterium]
MKTGKQKSGLASLYIILAGICWGIIGIFSRALAEYGFDPIMITATRCIITALCLLLFLLLKDPEKLKIKPGDIWYFIGTGICSIVFFNICYFVTIEETTLSVAAILLYTAPCFVGIMSAIFFKEKITKIKIIAFLAAFGGCILMSGVVGEGQMSLSGFGLLTGLGSGFGYALYSIFAMIALKKYHILTVTFYTFGVASMGLLPFGKVTVIGKLAVGNLHILGLMVLLAVISTLLPFLLYTKGLSHMEAGKASVMAFVEPMVATMTGILLFGETLNIENIIGIGLIFISLVLLNKKQPSR